MLCSDPLAGLGGFSPLEHAWLARPSRAASAAADVLPLARRLADGAQELFEISTSFVEASARRSAAKAGNEAGIVLLAEQLLSHGRSTIDEERRALLEVVGALRGVLDRIEDDLSHPP